MKKPNILTYLRQRFGKSNQEKEWDSHLFKAEQRMVKESECIHNYQPVSWRSGSIHKCIKCGKVHSGRFISN